MFLWNRWNRTVKLNTCVLPRVLLGVLLVEQLHGGWYLNVAYAWNHVQDWFYSWFFYCWRINSRMSWLDSACVFIWSRLLLQIYICRLVFWFDGWLLVLTPELENPTIMIAYTWSLVCAQVRPIASFTSLRASSSIFGYFWFSIRCIVQYKQESRSTSENEDGIG